MENTLLSTSMEGLRPKLAAKANGSSGNIDGHRLPYKPSQSSKPRNILKCSSLFSLSILPEPVRGGPRKENLQNFLWSRKTSSHDPVAIFFVFQGKTSCKTPSIILHFKCASYSVVTRKKRQNTNPHLDGNFFVDRFGLGILRDGCLSLCLSGLLRLCLCFSVFAWTLF